MRDGIRAYFKQLHVLGNETAFRLRVTSHVNGVVLCNMFRHIVMIYLLQEGQQQDTLKTILVNDSQKILPI